MSDVLLSSEKRNHFETMITEMLSEAFGGDVEVVVDTTGEVKLPESVGELSLWDGDDAFDEIAGTQLEFDVSPYRVESVDDPSVAFRIERDGW